MRDPESNGFCVQSPGEESSLRCREGVVSSESVPGKSGRR